MSGASARALAANIAADCRHGDCVWRRQIYASPAGLRELLAEIVKHAKTHAGACREVSIVVHASAETCDHEHSN